MTPDTAEPKAHICSYCDAVWYGPTCLARYHGHFEVHGDSGDTGPDERGHSIPLYTADQLDDAVGDREPDAWMCTAARCVATSSDRSWFDGHHDQFYNRDQCDDLQPHAGDGGPDPIPLYTPGDTA